MRMSNETYDVLKKICLMITPFVAFILALTDTWGFSWGAEAAATVSALGALLGACLDISTKHYHADGGDGDA